MARYKALLTVMILANGRLSGAAGRPEWILSTFCDARLRKALCRPICPPKSDLKKLRSETGESEDATREDVPDVQARPYNEMWNSQLAVPTA